MHKIADRPKIAELGDRTPDRFAGWQFTADVLDRLVVAGPSCEVAGVPWTAFRQRRRLVSCNRPRRGPSSGQSQPRAQVSGLRNHLDRDLVDDADIEAGVHKMADSVWDWCAGHSSSGRTMTLKIKYADFQQITRSRSAPTAITTRQALRQLSLSLVRPLMPTTKATGDLCYLSRYRSCWRLTASTAHDRRCAIPGLKKGSCR